jgi:hypothetical protein
MSHGQRLEGEPEDALSLLTDKEIETFKKESILRESVRRPVCKLSKIRVRKSCASQKRILE